MPKQQYDSGDDLARALRLHQAGDLQGAASLYLRILEAEPQQADAMHLLGVVAHQCGEHAQAESLVRGAIDLNADDACYHNNLGDILAAQGRAAEALPCFRRALALQPELSEAEESLRQLGAQGVGAVAKYECSVSAHASRADCVHTFDQVVEPAAESPGRLAAAVPCVYTRLKHRLIRLRRRGHDDWPHFVDEVTRHLDAIVTHLNTRWLVSICDTYADHGSDIEQRNALLVSLLANWEKLAATRRLAFAEHGQPPDPAARERLAQPQELWDGMSTMVLAADADVIPNLFRRLGGLLQATPVLHRILQEILTRMQQDPGTTLSALDQIHVRGLFDDARVALANNETPAPEVAEAAAVAGQGTADWQQAVVAALGDIAAGVQAQLQQGAALQHLDARLDAVSGRLDSFIERDFAHFVWTYEVQHRDLLQLFDRAAGAIAPVDVELKTAHPVATDSPDHRFPNGTARDNTRAPWFVRKCEALFGRQLAALDLGCAGGGLVRDFTLRGHTAFGLEGSDYSSKRLRAEWGLLADRLFTCDIRKPFELTRSGGTLMQFDVVTAWDVLEHLDEASLPQFFDNVKQHLHPDGYFVGSVSTSPSKACPDGSRYHVTVRSRQWWEDCFARYGFELLNPGPFAVTDYARGNAASPMYQGDFSRNPEAGFLFAAKAAAGENAHAGPEQTGSILDGVSGEQWLTGVEHEVGFWDEWLRTGGLRWPDQFRDRLDPKLPVSEDIAHHLRASPEQEVTILDVGAGPLTSVGKTMPGKTVRVTAIDPLAEQYSALLDTHNIDAPVRTQPGFAEELTARLAPASFDLVHARNCVDHAIDPLVAFREMLAVVKPGGVVLLYHHENEGQNESYEGFHQWDFTARDGAFIIQGADGRQINVSTEVAAEADVEVKRRDKFVAVVMRRKADAGA